MTENVIVANASRTQHTINDPKVRGIIYQVIALVLVAIGIFWVVNNTIVNLERANIASGFGFFNARAGFDISQTVLSFSSDSSYGWALVIGFLNTVQVAVAGIVTATILGFIIGLGRLSSNQLISKLCAIYVEVFRNIPPLLIVFFLYVGVISSLPKVQQSIALPFSIFINNRGVSLPVPVFGDAGNHAFGALVAALLLSTLLFWWSKRRQAATGYRFPSLWISVALIVLLPLIVIFATEGRISFDIPQLGRFRLEGGIRIAPEFLSLFAALSLYTAAYIAEIVRSGIMGITHGQTEAAQALGLSSSQTTRLVVVPQALRVIIPPLTSQYLNLMKDSSLAIAVGYADIVSVGGTIINQTGQAIEVISIWALVYLGLSLAASGFMNWFNSKIALVER
ncbi:amino acid ABC transporter permease [Brucella intermedia]|uniref:amino acid ABC transporter permease n=1 Tax=Brucella intermedia TaxID=94625 RepID=UPI00224A4F53|nr:amino acid ABC transporter permease [Brucella intermedia]